MSILPSVSFWRCPALLTLLVWFSSICRYPSRSALLDLLYRLVYSTGLFQLLRCYDSGACRPVGFSMLASIYVGSASTWPVVDPALSNQRLNRVNCLLFVPTLVRASRPFTTSDHVRVLAFFFRSALPFLTLPPLPLALTCSDVPTSSIDFLFPLVSPCVGSSLTGSLSGANTNFFAFARSPLQVRHVKMLNTKHFGEVLQLV